MRVIDPVFSVVWEAAMRKSGIFLYLELSPAGSLGATIDRRGIVVHQMSQAGPEELIREAVEFLFRMQTPPGIVVFGEAAGTWPDRAAQLAESGISMTEESYRIYTVDHRDVSVAARQRSDLVCDERIEVELRTVEQAKGVFAQMMDQALAAALRVGCDADDVECDRLVRLIPGERWHALEDWTREPKMRPIELRLRSIVARPATVLPELIEVRG